MLKKRCIVKIDSQILQAKDKKNPTKLLIIVYHWENNAFLATSIVRKYLN